MTAVRPLGITIAPMGMLAKLDAAANLVRLRFSLFARLVLIATVPIIAGETWVRYSLDSVSSRSFDPADASGLDVLGFGFGNTGRTDSIVILVLSMLPAALMGMWIGAAMRQLIDGSEPTLRSVLAAGLRLTHRLLAVWLVARLLLVIGSFACGIGALIVMPFLALAMPLMGFERTTIRQTMARSGRLAKKAYGTVLASILLTAVASALVMGTVYLAASIVYSIIGFSDLESMWIVSSVVSALTRLATVPFAAAVAFVTYVDLRCKIEGWDLAARASIAFER